MERERNFGAKASAVSLAAVDVGEKIMFWESPKTEIPGFLSSTLYFAN